jgi:hypothetical protein
MTTIAQVASVMQELLTSLADQLGWEVGFTQRQSKLTGAVFAQALVFGWLANPQATEEQLAQGAAAQGVRITPQGLTARFTWPAAQLLQRLLEAAVGRVIHAARPALVPVLQRFNGVYLQDSTTITLPDALVDVWRGSGATPQNGTVAGLKVQVQWDYVSGQLSQLVLQDGAAQDRSAPLQTSGLPPGALRLADMGYFSLPVLLDYSAAGVYWLSRPTVNTLLWTADGQCLDQVALLAQSAGEQVDLPVCLGKDQRLPCRLLARRVPQEVADRRRQALHQAARRKGQTVSAARLALADWIVLVTNAPAACLTVTEAIVLMACRWQIELLFKLWKSGGQIDESRSQQPWRRLTEVYAKLLAMVIQHWLLLMGAWSQYDRSLVKAAQTIQSHAIHLAIHLKDIQQLVTAITVLAICLAAGCRINKSRRDPRTCQRLLALQADEASEQVALGDVFMLSVANLATS